MHSSLYDDLDALNREYDGYLELMDKVKSSGTRERSDKDYDQAAPHVKEVQGHIDFHFQAEMSRKLGVIDEINDPNYWDYWQNGAEVNNGEVPCGPYFSKRLVPKQSKMKPIADHWQNHPIIIPKDPFKFMKQHNLKRAWKEFLERNRQHFIEINADEILINPIRSFAVEQGDYNLIEGIKVYCKLRSCWDFRAANSYCPQTGKLIFWGTKEIVTMMGMCIAGRMNLRAPMRQDNLTNKISPTNF